MYTQAESFFCNRIFPCFDQPNIKGILDLTVIAPAEWEVICNENIQRNSLFPVHLKLANESKEGRDFPKDFFTFKLDKELSEEVKESLKCRVYKPT